jgi:amidohydrolase
VAIIDEISGWGEELTSWRQHIHAHPETAFEEFATGAFVEEKLKGFGLDVTSGLAGTGKVASLTGKQTGPHIALRADLDALNMSELNDIAHRSNHPGKMHACGHDGHTVMLLGAAKYLALHRNFAGTVHFVFQPAEENEGGGRVMIEEGFFDRFPAEQVFGMHNWPALPAGEFAVHSGPVMASADRFTVKLLGRGGHGAMPHQSRDPIVAAAQIVTALQTIVSRNVAPSDSAVISVTRIQAGETYNVTPESAEIWGTTRCFSEPVREIIQQRMVEIIEGIASAFQLDTEIDYKPGYPATINTSSEADLAAVAAAQTVGEARVHRALPPTMGAEDFAYFLNERPGCYVWLGSGSSADSPGLHHPYFDFNDAVIPVGASYWVHLVESRLAAG